MYSNVGDKIGVLLDFTKGKCCYFLNGKYTGRYAAIGKNDEYYAVIHCYYQHDKYTLTFPSKFPKTP